MTAGRSKSRFLGTGHRYFLVGIGVALLIIGAVYFLATANLRSLGLPFGEWPRLPFYVYTTSKVTLTFDGEEIAIEGTTRCRRDLELDEEDRRRLPAGIYRLGLQYRHIGYPYRCGPEWLGHRLKDGSALLVGAHGVSEPWLRTWRARFTEENFRARYRGHYGAAQIGRVPPAVIWLDDAEAPTRAEYYYGMAALDDPRSRLTALRHEAEVRPASLWTSLFTGGSVHDPSEQVPAAGGTAVLHRFVAHYAVEIPQAQWSSVEGLHQALAMLSEAALLRPGQQLSATQVATLNDIMAREVDRLPPRFLREGTGTMLIDGPVAVATLPAAGRDDATGTAVRSARAETSAFDSFRLEDGLPDGVIAFSLRTRSRMTDPAALLLGNQTVREAYNKLLFGGLLYDPAAGAIYSLRVAEF